MAKIASLVVSLSANSAKLDKDLKKARVRTKKFSKNVSSDFKRIAGAIGAIITGAGLKALVETTASFEDLQSTLKSVFGSSKLGEKAFKRIQAMSTKTQFGIEDLSKTFIKLRSSGITPTDDLLRIFTDTAAVTTDQIGTLEAMTDLFSRTTSGGLGLEDLNRLADRGVPVFDILSKKLNLSKQEVAKFGKSVEGSTTMLKALADGIDERFGGATKDRLGNLSTLMSNFKIEIGNTSNEIGTKLAPALKEIIKDFTEWLAANRELAGMIGTTMGDSIRLLADGLKLLKQNMDLVFGAVTTIVYIQALRQVNFVISDMRKGTNGLTKSFSKLFKVMRGNPYTAIIGVILGLIVGFNGMGRSLAQASAAIDYLWDRLKDLGAKMMQLVSTPIKWLGEGILWTADLFGISSDAVDDFGESLKELAKDTVQWAKDAIPAHGGLIQAIKDAGVEYDNATAAAEKLAEANKKALTLTVPVINGTTTAGSTGTGTTTAGGLDLGLNGAGKKPSYISAIFSDPEEKKAFSKALSSGIISAIRDKEGWKGIKDAFSNSLQNQFFKKMEDSLDDMIGGLLDSLDQSFAKAGGGGSAGGLGGLFSGLFDWGASFFAAKGGMVPQYLSAGGAVARGTDTVPAMLTAGEVVLNAAQQKNVAGAMGGSNVTINISGNVDQRAIDQIKRVVASDPVMIHQLGVNGKDSVTGLRR